ncbi:AAA family ATPase, partial [Celeribacter halophilus]|uniref:AAA family ATPase n=1 Tax=Celeribacter halophilus TaxID=576117 RepID=UPI0008322F59
MTHRTTASTSPAPTSPTPSAFNASSSLNSSSFPLPSITGPRTERPVWWPYAQATLLRLSRHCAELQALDAALQSTHDEDADEIRFDDDPWDEEQSTAYQPSPLPTSGPTSGPGAKSRCSQAHLPEPSPLAALSSSPLVQHLPDDLWRAIAADGGDPFATTEDGRSRAEVTIPRSDLVLAVRLAATFKSADNFADLIAPDAVSVLTGVPEDQRSSVRRLLKDIFLPEGWIIINTRPPVMSDDLNHFLLLEPTARPDQLVQALTGASPLILFCDDAHELLPEFREAPVRQLEFAPLTADILIAVLQASHSATGRIDEAATRAALPDEGALSQLDMVQLLLALRASTARDVAAQIAQMAQTAKDASSSATGGQSQRSGESAGAITDQIAARISGNSPAHETARRMVADLCAWQAGELDWADCSRSLLLYGAPGTGKTWLARSMGAAADVHFLQASFAEWQAAGPLNTMLGAMVESFDKAIKSAPCVVFIDEIDACGSRLDGSAHNRNYRTQVINGFLEQIDRLMRSEGALLIGACNFPETLDPAILRDGRFDLKCEMPLPDRATIHVLLSRGLGERLAPDELDALSTEATGKTPAELDAAIRAAKSDARHLGLSLDAALLRKHLRIDAVDPKILRRIALHEAGHTLMAQHLAPGSVRKITLTPTGGETQRAALPAALTKVDIEDELATLLAGRAAERLVLGDASNGAGGPQNSDLALATRLALDLETRLGLGGEGLTHTDASVPQLLTDQARRLRVHKHLQKAEARAMEFLKARQADLNALAEELVAKREVSGEEA